MSNKPMTDREVVCEFLGRPPECCDFCGESFSKNNHPEPEEGGMWACADCVSRWDIEERMMSFGKKIKIIKETTHARNLMSGDVVMLLDGTTWTIESVYMCQGKVGLIGEALTGYAHIIERFRHLGLLQNTDGTWSRISSKMEGDK